MKLLEGHCSILPVQWKGPVQTIYTLGLTYIGVPKMNLRSHLWHGSKSAMYLLQKPKVQILLMGMICGGVWLASTRTVHGWYRLGLRKADSLQQWKMHGSSILACVLFRNRSQTL